MGNNVIDRSETGLSVGQRYVKVRMPFVYQDREYMNSEPVNLNELDPVLVECLNKINTFVPMSADSVIKDSEAYRIFEPSEEPLVESKADLRKTKDGFLELMKKDKNFIVSLTLADILKQCSTLGLKENPTTKEEAIQLLKKHYKL